MLFNKFTLQTFVFKSNELVNYNNINNNNNNKNDNDSFAVAGEQATRLER